MNITQHRMLSDWASKDYLVEKKEEPQFEWWRLLFWIPFTITVIAVAWNLI